MNKRIWPRPVVIPLPDETMGSGDVSINLLEEDWSMNLYPPQEFWKKDMDLSGWEKIGLPMQVDAPDREYAFAKDIHIPDSHKAERKERRFGAFPAHKGFGRFVEDTDCCSSIF